MGDESDTAATEAQGIVATAVSLISDRGVEALSIESVAVLAGVDSKTVAAHYDSVPALIEAAVLLDEREFNAEVKRRWEDQDSAAGQLLSLFRHLVLQYDWSVWVELWSLALREEWAGELRNRIDSDYRGLFETVISRGVTSGEFTVADTTQTAIALATIVDSLAVQATLGDPRVSPHFMLDTCVECATRLLGTELESPSLAAGGFGGR